MPNMHDEIRSQTEAFARDIAALARRLALEAVATALGASEHAAPIPKAAPAKPAPAKKAAPVKAAPVKKAAAPAPKPAPVAKAPAKAAPAAKAPAAPAKKPAAVKRPLGAKRPPDEIAKLVERLGAYIQQNPGNGVEVIGKALATPTSELTLPIKKLLGAKRVRFEGLKRSTRYFPV